jgi:cyclopropane-fatty-acyl-phospholipid synthase
VGEAYWPSYFKKLRDGLRPGGFAVLQVIIIDDARFAEYRRMPDFVQTHIFPGGMLPTIRIIEQETARAGLQLVASEFFGESYARTLAAWRARFQKAWPTIEGLGYDDRFRKTWEYYLAYCQAGFETGIVSVGLYQLRRGAE